MARPDTEGGGPEGQQGTPAPDVVRPGTGVVRPGSGQGAAGAAGVVRPPTAAPPGATPPAAGVVLPPGDVVRPGTDVVRPGTASVEGAAKAVAAVPEAPEAPQEPIHIVLPLIPVKPVKQGFLDRLVAGKSEADKAAEEAKKADDARRRAEEKARKHAEDVRRAKAEARRKAEESARKKAEEQQQAEAEAEERARAKAEELARKQTEAQRERELAQERAAQKARRAQERALQKAREDEELDHDEDGYEGDEGRVAPARPAPQRPAPTAPPRPGPPRPSARPSPARALPGRGPARGPVRAGRDERYDERYEAPRGRRPRWQWALAVVAIVAVGGGSAAVAGVVAPEPVVVYQVGLDTGGQAPILGRLDGGAAMPSRSGLEAALSPLMGSPGLGPSPAVAVADPTTGAVLWERRGDAVVTPASATKVLTAIAVLTTRGPNYRIPTRAVAGANPGDVVLVGGGDPSLATGEVAYYRGAGRLDALAEQVRAALGGATPNRVIIDGHLYPDGQTVGPSGTGNLGSAVTYITALMIDAGHSDPAYRGDRPSYHQQPDLAAAQAFAAALGVPESRVQLGGTAPADARVLGEVLSPPVATIVEQMLANSDNVVAEMMARQVALAKGMPPTFAGGAQATHSALADLGVPMPSGTGLVDGSGLSRDDRVTANYLLSVLTRAASPDHPQLRSLISGLAVAGYSGTLDDRGRAGRGTVRAKTGTLNGVNALVGYVVDADGRLLAFAAVANGTPGQFAGEAALDRIAERVSLCGCG